MSMIKRARTGKIEEMFEKHTRLEEDDKSPDLTWSNELLIKDVLSVPLTTPPNIDIDLNAEEDCEIAVKC